MPIPAHQLDAFHAVAEAGSFSRAAKRLGVSQPALSQRIQQLESDLKSLLFLRSPEGVRVTDAGARLLRYCQVQRALESELLADLAVDGPGGGGVDLSGAIRIAAFSSIARSCVMPALAPLFRQHPRLTADVAVDEIPEIAAKLRRGAVDFAFVDHVLERPDVEHVALASEELVLVESRRFRTRDDVYLDHDPDDRTTLQFLERNRTHARHVHRSFFDDIYGVLDGAVLGFGRAVVPRHLLCGHVAEQLRVVRTAKPTRSAVVLHYFRQPSYTRAHDAVREALVSGVRAALLPRVRREAEARTR
jgi:DNA-binding transcriptional LysR family regulator